MEENNKSLTPVNHSLAKIEKQIAIGEKILEIENQSFILLISRDFYFQIISIEDYKNLTENLIFNKKTENIFIENLISIKLVTRKSKIIFFTKFGKYLSTSFDKILKIKNLKHLLKFEIQDEIVEIILIDDLNNIKGKQLLFITKNGFIKKTKLKLFIDEILRSEVAVKLNEYDFLVKAKIVNTNSLIVISTKLGHLFCIKAFKIRSCTKNSFGDIQVKLVKQNNVVIGLSILENSEKDYDAIFISEKDCVRKRKLHFYHPYNNLYEYTEEDPEVKAAREKLDKKQNEEILLKGIFTQNQETQSNTLNNSVKDWEPSFSINSFISYVDILQDETVFLIITNKNYFFKFEADRLRSITRLKDKIRFPEGTKINNFSENEYIQTIVKLPNVDKKQQNEIY
jgi:DNA gyrase/topoisomerase IV subunit A